jgi:predicted ATPase
MAFERVEHEDAVAIFYSIAGQSLNQFRTLSAYEMQSQLGMIFEETYHVFLDQWNAIRSFDQAIHPQAILEKWLGFRLNPGNQIDDFLQTFCHVEPDLLGFLIKGSVFPNPMAYARDPKNWGNIRPLDVISGLQHGDLNTNNILVKFNRNNEALDGYYLIDFAMFKRDMPLLYDLRYLEISYLVLRQSKVSLEKCLELITQLGENDRLDPHEIPIDVAGVGEVISSTRDVFGNWLEKNHPSLQDDLWGQYWLAGVAAGLSYCHKAAMREEERLAGLVYAAANLKRFAALFGLPYPSEGQQLYNPSGIRKENPFQASVRPDHGNIQNNLPTQTTTFVGRQAQVAAARELILSDSVRLITFTGPGGSGKTRLSLQIACEVLNQFPDGVYFVPLAETTNLTLVVSKIAKILEVREGNSQSQVDKLKDYLSDKALLLVLDNFEQLVGASPLIADLLEAAPRLRLLVSSRVLLRIRGEHEFPVTPLETPSPTNLASLEKLQQNESIQLFLQRARSANPKFALSTGNAPYVAEICRKLDGLPLAIELAAARTKLLPPQDMVSRLNDRLGLLTGGARDLPARQQTLRNTLDWSHSLLNPEEKILFARLGIFVGGFGLDAAESVCNLDGTLDILSNTEALLNNSLLYQEEGLHGQTRFRMLETVREYALEELKERSEFESLQARHARFYNTKVAMEIGYKFFSAESTMWLDWLEAEHDNLRAALTWALEDPELQVLKTPLILFLSWFWYRRGYLSEGRGWAERILAMPQARQGQPGRAIVQLGSAMVALWQGNARTAFKEAEECLATLKRIEEERFLPVAFLNLGIIHINQGNDQAAYPLVKEAAALFQGDGNTYFQAVSMVHLGNVSLGLGKPEEARQWLEKAYPITREQGDPWAISFALNNLGEVARVEGDYTKARGYYEESEALLRVMGDQGDLARLIHNLAYVARHEGDLEKAHRLFHESLQIFRKFGNKRGIAECLMGLAGLKAETHQPERAAQLFSAAEAILSESGTAWWPADRREVERNRQAILSQLDESTYQAEYARGWDMPLEQKFANALDEA